MRTKVFLILLIITLFVIFDVQASNNYQVEINFFWAEGCPHCKDEQTFLNYLKLIDNSIKINSYEVRNNQENQEKLELAAQKLNIKVSGVPFLLIGQKYIVGYLNDETSGVQIQNLINECKASSCSNLLAAENEITGSLNDNNQNVLLPKVGNLDLNKLSLPLATIILGLLDGFNPCAMWVLLFLISLLLGMEDKKKMWVLGTTFIVSSAFVYFLFMVAWLKIFLFIGYEFWIRLLIGVVAIIGSVFGFKKYFSKNATGCEITGEEKRKYVFEKLGKITTNKSFILSLIGIAGLAFAVNLIELICSFGLPAIYTQVLALNTLTQFKYYAYIFVYIFFFMMDDLFVFIAAMITLQLTGITTKYVKLSKLICSILLLIIGMLLILKPELLMLG